VAKIPGCTITRVGRLTIEADQPMLYHVDGEPIEGGTSLRVRIHPGALRVAVR
jgi:diacylglycerol kinase family enzyme